jgi:hypothetical protein
MPSDAAIFQSSSANARAPKVGYLLASVGLAFFAFLFNWKTGHRGVFFEDQSGMFDGGWRVLQGQTPYKDFLIPFGPVTFWIQGLFFKLFGVNWSATVLPACTFNTLATLCIIRIVRLLSGGSRTLGLCSGILTAVSFQAPFGTLGLEQTAMFFDLLALQAMVESFNMYPFRRNLWLLASGAMLAIAILSKQNYGVFFVPIILAMAAASELQNFRRAFSSVLIVVAGIVAAIAIFFVWVSVYSDFSSFVERVLVVAAGIGRSRLGAVRIIKALSFQEIPNAIQLDVPGIVPGCIVLFLACFNRSTVDFEASVWCRMAPASALTILLPWFRSMTQGTTDNEWQNNFAFAGLAGGLGLSLVLFLGRRFTIAPNAAGDFIPHLPSTRAVRIFVCSMAGVWGIAAMLYEGSAAWTRKVQEFEAGTDFRKEVQVRGMEGVWWGEPTRTDQGSGSLWQETDFEKLVSWLSNKRCHFFVMGDSTILYGLLRVPSPQPLLYFLPNHAFRAEEIPELDGAILASLERNGVTVVVREKKNWQGTNEVYDMFPRTWAWFTSRFDRTAEFGNWEVWELRQRSTD